MKMKRIVLSAAAITALVAPLFAQADNLAEGEVQRCEDKIASAVRDVLGKYGDALAELQAGFQKAADLDGALAVRGERQRVMHDGVLTDQNLVAEPKSLRALQTQVIARLKELTTQLVNDTVPKLIEYKKALTMSGKLDDALLVRNAIERLQNGYVPASRADAGTNVTAETLLTAYAGDRARADKIYKGQKIVVRGIVGGFRADPADAKVYLVFLTSGANGGWLQCAFAVNDYQIREEKQFNNTVIVITGKGKDAVTARYQKGAPTDIRGVCDGLDEMVRLSKCEPER